MNQRDLELTPEQHEILTLVARRFDLEPEDVMAWAIELLTRYVDAGGQP